MNQKNSMGKKFLFLTGLLALCISVICIVALALLIIYYCKGGINKAAMIVVGIILPLIALSMLCYGLLSMCTLCEHYRKSVKQNEEVDTAAHNTQSPITEVFKELSINTVKQEDMDKVEEGNASEADEDKMFNNPASDYSTLTVNNPLYIK